MSAEFEDRMVWITGGSSGIGRALALEFADQGADVAVSGRRIERLAEVVEVIEAKGRRGLAVPCDVTDESVVEAAVARVVDELGRLDVAVANAGFSVGGRIETLSADDWRRQFDVNVVGLAVTARHALPELRKTQGRLALVGSVSGMIAGPGFGAYSASKYAVRAIGQTLAIELHGSGVSCTTIHPGFVHSEISKVDNQGTFHPERKDKRPQKLMWEPEDAARVMVRAIAKRKREYTFTGHGKLLGFLGRHAPGLTHFVAARSKGVKRRSDRAQKNKD
jgi:NAD(P)-dependent dehydrogenase (short-subunit alcohol dehydrogenase family)